MVTNGWENRTLESLCDSSAPITYGVLKPGDYVDDGVPLLQIKDLLNDLSEIDALHRISPELDLEYKRSRIATNDILISLVGTVGRIGLVPEALNGANIHRNLGRIRTNNYEFLVHYLNSDIAKNRIGLSSSGSSQSALNLSVLRALKVSIPPLPEQRKIAKILSTWDKAIATTEKLIETSKQQKKALMQQLLTGKKRLVNPETGKAFEGEWEEVKVSSLITKHSEKTEINKQYPVLTSSRKGIFFQSDYYNDRDVASEDTTGYNVVPRGYFTYRHMSDDLIFKFNRNTICDRGIVSTLYPVFLANEDTVVPYLLQAVLNEGSAFKRFSLSQKQGGSRTYMYLSKLNELKLQIPNLIEQQKIASVLTAADKEIEVLQAKLAHFKQEKKALMQQLLTGKRRVVVE